MSQQPDPKSTLNISPTKIWASLVTNTSYLSGLLTLDYSLKKHHSKYSLVALYTDSFPENGHKVLDRRKIPKKRVDYLLPSMEVDYSNDLRFKETWTKLACFSLVEYQRLILLDSDMLVLKNMDELMDLELDSPKSDVLGNKVFAASHACCCNPLKKPHYPKNWTRENCAFTMQHNNPDLAQSQGAPVTAGLGILNSGILVIRPSAKSYDTILRGLADSSAVANYQFPDQDLLADLFRGRWVPLPYIYNALKTMRSEDVHAPIWRDAEVKNVHYILSPKPWNERLEDVKIVKNDIHLWWWTVNGERKIAEASMNIDDDF